MRVLFVLGLFGHGHHAFIVAHPHQSGAVHEVDVTDRTEVDQMLAFFGGLQHHVELDGLVDLVACELTSAFLVSTSTSLVR